MKAEIVQEIEYRTGKTTFLRTDEGQWFKVATWPYRHDMEIEHLTGKQSKYETKLYASRVRQDERPDRWGREIDARVSYCKAVALKAHDGMVGRIQRYGRIK
jgi:hypothetical protein